MLSKTQVKYIQSLGQKKFRDEHAVFIAEGPKLAIEILTHKKELVKAVYAIPSWIETNHGLLDNISVTEIDEKGLERISQLKTPNQVLVVAKIPQQEREPDIKGKIILMLDTIQDPGNFGTIIRTADWFGIEQVVCSHDCADLYNPKVVQATMGSVARIRVIYADLLTWLRENHYPATYAAVLNGKDLKQIGKITEGVIIIGNESKGISEPLLNVVREKITIPQKGSAESLNAAVAAGIILSHLT